MCFPKVYDNFLISSIPSNESIYKTECELVQRMDVTTGIFQIASDCLYFFAFKKKSRATKKFEWPISKLREMYRRTFLMRNSALEIFLQDRTSIFLNFPLEETPKALAKIVALHPPHLINFANIPAEKLIAKSKLTRKWQERKISNFQYLMALNTLSGRTFNDLNQYPVFPWVIQDYTSTVLDLNNPATFRDLTKPIGALNEKRLQQFIER